MEQKQQFINLPKDAVKRLFSPELNDFDHKLYIYLRFKSTFKYELFGIYKQETFQTLKNAINDACGTSKDITQIKRSISKLEKLKLLTVQNSKSCLVVCLDYTKTLADTVSAIEKDYKTFNLYPERLKELRDAIGVNTAAVFQNNQKQIEESTDLSPDTLEKLGW
ncbi:hypothetical protein [Variovorax sp. E3]|uniref:hypothetical protein n=1 Tax=Variovorax sp. E3 TaxID=1914993 RepID=UPI0018DCDFCA|nr:hypothetical protein [Variovorax sp. E3]